VALYDQVVTRAKGGRRRGPAPSLTLERIVEAALRLIDSGGIAALTTRRLAADMGVGAMTLYSYVRTKEELLDRVAESALSAMVPVPDPALGWTGNLAAAARGIRERLTERPGTLEIMLASRNVSPASLNPARDHMLAPLLEAGFPPASAVEAVSAVQVYAFGFALAQRSHGRITEDTTAWAGSVDPGSFPSLSRVAGQYADRFSRDAFESGLAELIEKVGDDFDGCAPS
jgi:AcrR family transcriptional regulator